MSLRLFGLSVFLAATSLSSLAAAQAPARSIGGVLDTLDRVRGFHQTAISPDGRRVAWVEDVSVASEATAIFVRTIGAPAGDTHGITASNDGHGHKEDGVAWSPDNHTVAFLSDAGPTAGQQQVYVIDVDGNSAARRVTSVKGQLAEPRWSPDGKQLAILFVAGSTQGTGALVAYKPDSGVVGDVVEEQRIAIVDLGTRAVREVSPANMFVYDYDWSPDGQAFAAEAVEGSGTNNYWIAQLYVVRVDTGKTTSIWKPPLQIAGPRWSPDGKSIAVIHGIMSDEGSTGGDIYVVPAAGGTARNITPNLEGSARALAWQPDGRLIFNEYVDGKSALVTVGAVGGSRTTVWSTPQQQLTQTSIAAHADAVAAVVQSFQQAPEVYAGRFGAWSAQTNANASIKPLWGEVKSLHWKSDKYQVQGWLMYTANFDSSKKYPLVVSVHGGPSSANFPVWPTRWNAVLPASGYFVLLPNPRGSYGGGEAFTLANVNDFGYGDMRDIEAGVAPPSGQRRSIPIAPASSAGAAAAHGHVGGDAATRLRRRWRHRDRELAVITARTRSTPDAAVFGVGTTSRSAHSRSSPMTFIKKVERRRSSRRRSRFKCQTLGYEFWHAEALNVPTGLRSIPEGTISRPARRDIEERLWLVRSLPAVKVHCFSRPLLILTQRSATLDASVPPRVAPAIRFRGNMKLYRPRSHSPCCSVAWVWTTEEPKSGKEPEMVTSMLSRRCPASSGRVGGSGWRRIAAARYHGGRSYRRGYVDRSLGPAMGTRIRRRQGQGIGVLRGMSRFTGRPTPVQTSGRSARH